MGIYLNPGNGGFKRAINSEIYVDKTGLLEYTNKALGTEQCFICVSRPRRFGKSMAANMLAAYYSRGCESEKTFQGYDIEKSQSFKKYLNQYNVIFLNMQSFFSRTHNIVSMRELLEEYVLQELFIEYPEINYLDKTDFVQCFKDVFAECQISFVFVIDEWDCIFREKKHNLEEQKEYLDFLRNLLKDQEYVALAYMTGILPIKKYGTHSALNMFDEFSMTEPDMLAEYVGFTEEEVKALCKRFGMDFEETQRWYDGYLFENDLHIYSPKSVVDAMRRKRFGNYWTQTETYEALKIYMNMNFDGLKDAIVQMLTGNRCIINIRNFQNDMTTFRTKDDVLTLLVHLGYLAYDERHQQVFIPNLEVEGEFRNAMTDGGWDEVIKAVASSEELLKEALKGNAEAVAKGVAKVHAENTAILAYNNENALSCVISLAFYAAKKEYKIIREFPTGKGFADVVFLPRKHSDKPVMVIELKCDKSAEGAITQIKNRGYVEALENYAGEVLLVGINYDRDSKEHTCVIEEWNK